MGEIARLAAIAVDAVAAVAATMKREGKIEPPFERKAFLRPQPSQRPRFLVQPAHLSV